MSDCGNYYNINEESLDKHFQQQLYTLNKLLTKHENRTDLAICDKWVSVFYNASPKEKMARNCLMLLLYSQIKERSTLWRPFTDFRNCLRSLDEVLREHNADLNTFSTEDSETDASSLMASSNRHTFNSHKCMDCQDRALLGALRKNYKPMLGFSKQRNNAVKFEMNNINHLKFKTLGEALDSLQGKSQSHRVTKHLSAICPAAVTEYFQEPELKFAQDKDKQIKPITDQPEEDEELDKSYLQEPKLKLSQDIDKHIEPTTDQHEETDELDIVQTLNELSSTSSANCREFIRDVLRILKGENVVDTDVSETPADIPKSHSFKNMSSNADNHANLCNTIDEEQFLFEEPIPKLDLCHYEDTHFNTKADINCSNNAHLYYTNRSPRKFNYNCDDRKFKSDLETPLTPGKNKEYENFPKDNILVEKNNNSSSETKDKTVHDAVKQTCCRENRPLRMVANEDHLVLSECRKDCGDHTEYCGWSRRNQTKLPHETGTLIDAGKKCDCEIIYHNRDLMHDDSKERLCGGKEDDKSPNTTTKMLQEPYFENIYKNIKCAMYRASFQKQKTFSSEELRSQRKMPETMVLSLPQIGNYPMLEKRMEAFGKDYRTIAAETIEKVNNSEFLGSEVKKPLPWNETLHKENTQMLAQKKNSKRTKQCVAVVGIIPSKEIQPLSTDCCKKINYQTESVSDKDHNKFQPSQPNLEQLPQNTNDQVESDAVLQISNLANLSDSTDGAEIIFHYNADNSSLQKFQPASAMSMHDYALISSDESTLLPNLETENRIAAACRHSAESTVPKEIPWHIESMPSNGCPGCRLRWENEQLTKEISALRLQFEAERTTTEEALQHDVIRESQPLDKRVEKVKLDILNGGAEALRSVRDWSTSHKPINFFSIAFGNILADQGLHISDEAVAEFKQKISKLDEKFQELLVNTFLVALEKRTNLVKYTFEDVLEEKFKHRKHKAEKRLQLQVAVEQQHQQLDRLTNMTMLKKILLQLGADKCKNLNNVIMRLDNEYEKILKDL